MVFFTMVPSTHHVSKRSRTLKKKDSQTRRTHTVKYTKPKRLKKKIKQTGGTTGGDCETSGLITEPGLNIPSLLRGQNSGLNISKTIAKIEQQNGK